jgi:O-antigen ligase/cytochrome c-type biogenesis protein CcmH/NrfG
MTSFDRSWLRGALVWVVALKCAGMVLVFDPVSISAFDLPKAVFSRATEWLLAALILLILVRFGIGVVPRTRIHLTVGLLVLTSVAATIFAENRFVALYGEHERYLGLTSVLDMAVLYVAVALGFHRTRDWAVLLIVGAATALVVLGYAIAQLGGLDPIPWVDNPESRPFATLGNPDVLGRFASVVFGISLGVGAFAAGRSSRWIRPIAIAFVIGSAILAGIVATRSSLLGFGAAGIAGAVIYLLRAPTNRLGIRALLAAGTGAVVLGLLLISPLATRAQATLDADLGLEGRLAIYRTAVSAFGSRPILGYGPDGLGVAYPANRDERDAQILRRGPQSSAHSWVLQALATTGALGLTALVLAIGATGWTLWRTGLRRSPWVAGPLLLAFAAYWADALVGPGAVGVDWFPWLTFGAAAAVAGKRAEVLPELRRLPMIVSLLVIVAAIAMAFTGLFALAAGEEAGRARVIWLRKSSASVERAEAAVRLDPGRADYWNWLGLTLDLGGEWRRSGDAYAEAARRAPHDSTFWANLARSRARQAIAQDQSRGGVTAAIEAAQRGVQVDPNDPEANFVLGELASLFGRPDMAIGPAVKAVVLYPPDNRYDPIVLRAARGARDVRSAASELDRALKAKDSLLLRVAAAELALRLGDKATARAHAVQAARFAPTNADVVRLLRDTSLP